MSDVSAHWGSERLRNLTSKIGSGATPRGGEKAYVRAGTPLIRSMNVHFGGLRSEGLAYINDDQAAALNGAIVHFNDVLLNITGASIGRVTTAPKNLHGARVNQHVCIIRMLGLIDPAFVAQYLSSPSMQSFITAENYGVTRQALTKEMVEEIAIPIPPLPEQRRIVAKIDSLSAKSNRARDHLDHVSRLAERLKNTIVERAFSGELTPDCESTFDHIPFGEIVADGPTNGWSPRTGEDATGALTLKLTATTSGELRLDPKAVKRIYETPPEGSPFWLEPGDVLIQRANALEHLGATAIFDGPSRTYIYPDLMMRVRIPNEVDRRYVWRYLNSDMARSFFRANATGTAGNMPKISGATLRRLPIPFPDAEVRAEVVRRVDAALTAIGNLLRQETSARTLIDRLDQAVLSKAFRGELVPQDPDDEPASELLDRIRAERGSAAQPRRGRRRPRAVSA